MSYVLSHHRDWVPPFCPNHNCPFHNDQRPAWRFKRMGFFVRQAHPQRIRRFLCLHCHVSFSSQTFSADYWLKRPDILPKLTTKTCGAMANRQGARDLACSSSTVDRQLNRLGRHCLLFFAKEMQLAPPPTDLVIDGLETFELSQYFPFHHNVAVEAGNGLIRGFTDSPLRRKGRMTPFQKRRRQELEDRFGRPDPKAIAQGIEDLLAMALKNSQGRVTVCTDDHPAYRRPIGRYGQTITHVVVSSRARRDKGNPLWEVNLLDLIVRHASANHRRETLAWSKRRQGSTYRLAILTVWRNWIQDRWVKRPGRTPAMEAGIAQRPLTVREVLQERLFIDQIALSPRWEAYYWSRVETPALGRNRRHELKYAR
jgi:transposase-like protein